jgi:esterase/lipase superfamily enzyme
MSPPSCVTDSRDGWWAPGVPEEFYVTVRRLVQQEADTSRRAFLSGLLCSGSALTLGGCAGMAESATRLDASALAVNSTLLVATSRKPANDGRANPWFGPERNPTMTFARARLTPPATGVFSLAAIGMSDWKLDAVEPVSGKMGDLLAQASGEPDVLIYVHGFRTTFEGSVLDAARLSDGIKFRGSTMVFSWPSRAGFFDYAYDRESAVWSRDAFERALASVMSNPRSTRVHIVAHSMGTMLALEGLRQLYARYGDSAAQRIGAVVFASPDIDIDIFASSIARIRPLAHKITVISATNDRALALSSRVAGGVTRVGAAEKEVLEKLGLRVVDASGYGWGIINHDLFLSNDEVRRVIRRAVEDGRSYAG